jgi:hypothetical protein
MENTNHTKKACVSEESLCFWRSLLEQEGEIQKHKANANFPNHWASELDSSEVTSRNEGHTKMWKELEILILQQVVILITSGQIQNVGKEDNAYFWATCCVTLATRVSKGTHFSTYINIIFLLMWT